MNTLVTHSLYVKLSKNSKDYGEPNILFDVEIISFSKSMICLYIPTFLLYLIEIQWNTECIEVVLILTSIHLFG